MSRTDEKLIMKLQYTNGQVQSIESINGWRALVATDLHFSNTQSYFNIKKIPHTINKLGELIEEYNIQQLLLLGDIFHGSVFNDLMNQSPEIRQSAEEFVKDTLIKLSQWVPVYIIGGNHDRKVLHFAKSWNIQNLEIISQLFFQITPSRKNMGESSGKFHGSFNRIVFTHDAGNAYWLGDSEKIPFLRAIRTLHEHIFDKEAMLITGHTHSYDIRIEEKFCSLNPFHLSRFSMRVGLIVENENLLNFSTIIIKNTNWN